VFYGNVDVLLKTKDFVQSVWHVTRQMELVCLLCTVYHWCFNSSRIGPFSADSWFECKPNIIFWLDHNW